MALRKDYQTNLPELQNLTNTFVRPETNIEVKAKVFERDNGVVFISQGNDHIKLTYNDLMYLAHLVSPYAGADCNGNSITPEYMKTTDEEREDYKQHFAY